MLLLNNNEERKKKKNGSLNIDLMVASKRSSIVYKSMAILNGKLLWAYYI